MPEDDVQKCPEDDVVYMVMGDFILPLLKVSDLLKIRQLNHRMSTLATNELQKSHRTMVALHRRFNLNSKGNGTINLEQRMKSYISTMEAKVAQNQPLPFPTHVINIEPIPEKTLEAFATKIAPMITSLEITKRHPGNEHTTRLVKLLASSASKLQHLLIKTRSREMYFSESSIEQVPESFPCLNFLEIDVTEDFRTNSASFQCAPGMDTLSAIVMRAQGQIRKLNVKTVDAFVKVPQLLPYLAQQVNIGLTSYVRSEDCVRGLEILAKSSSQVRLNKLCLGITPMASLSLHHSTIAILYELLNAQSQNLVELKLFHGQIQSNVIKFGLQESILPAFRIPPMANLEQFIIRGRALTPPIVLKPCYSNQFQKLRTLEFPLQKYCNYFDAVPLRFLQKLTLTAEFKSGRIFGRDWGDVFPNLKHAKIIFDNRSFSYHGLEKILTQCKDSVETLELEYTEKYWSKGSKITPERNSFGWFSLTGGAEKVSWDYLLNTAKIPTLPPSNHSENDNEDHSDAEAGDLTGQGLIPNNLRPSLANLTKLKKLVLRYPPADVLAAVIYMTRRTTGKMPSVHFRIHTRCADLLPDFEWAKKYHQGVKVIKGSLD